MDVFINVWYCKIWQLFFKKIKRSNIDALRVICWARAAAGQIFIHRWNKKIKEK